MSEREQVSGAEDRASTHSSGGRSENLTSWLIFAELGEKTAYAIGGAWRSFREEYADEGRVGASSIDTFVRASMAGTTRFLEDLAAAAGHHLEDARHQSATVQANVDATIDYDRLAQLIVEKQSALNRDKSR